MRDTAGATATANLTVTIHGANDAPVLAAQTAAQNATVGTAFSFVLPTTTFTDVDSGDTLTYAATAADGSSLPAWLSFNATTRTFSGTPTAAGTYGVKVAATDLGGLAASETFNITAAPDPDDLQPVQCLQHAGADQPQRRSATRGRPQVPVERCRHHYRHQVLPQRQRHRTECRRPVVQHRHQARQRHLLQYHREWLADRELHNARHDRRQHHLCRLLPHHRRLRGDQQFLHQRRNQRPADSARQRQRRLPLRRIRHRRYFPECHLQRCQLLGRCGLPARFDRSQHDADGGCRRG